MFLKDFKDIWRLRWLENLDFALFLYVFFGPIYKLGSDCVLGTTSFDDRSQRLMNSGILLKF